MPDLLPATAGKNHDRLLTWENRLVRSEKNLRSVMKRYVTLRTTLQRLEEEEAENEQQDDQVPQEQLAEK